MHFIIEPPTLVSAIHARWVGASAWIYRQDGDGTCAYARIALDAPHPRACPVRIRAASVTERRGRTCARAAHEHTSDVVRGESLLIARLIRHPEVHA